MTQPSAKPPWAAYVWHDEANLYLQLPDSGYITKLPFTEGGLSRGLKLLRKPCKAPNGALLARPTVNLPRAFTQAERATARGVLKKMGMI